MGMIREKLGTEVIMKQEIRHLKSGSEGYLVIDQTKMDGSAVKRAAMDMEDGSEFGRLLDIDVMTKTEGFSRNDFGRESRKCLLCGEDAKVCSRDRRHEMPILLKKIEKILRKCPRL